MKKIVCLLLVCLMLLPFFAACKDKKENEIPTGTAAPAVDHPPEILKNLPQADFNNEKCVIYAFSGSSLVNYDENDTSEAVSKVAFDRTQFINDTFNCLIEMQIAAEPAKTYDAIKKNHDGGGDAYDIIMPHVEQGLPATMSEGYCADLLTLNNLSLDQSWYRQNQITNYQANGKLFIISTDLTIAGEGTLAFAYNKLLYQTLGGTEDLYQLVSDGDWTLAVFLSELKKLQATGFDVGTSTHGTYALASNYGVYRAPLLWGAGVETAKTGDGNQWTMVFTQKSNREKINKVLDAINDITENVVLLDDGIPDDYGKYRARWYSELHDAPCINLFVDGKVAFLLWDVGSMYSDLREADFDIGYLPPPKMDTQQVEYRIEGGAGPTGIPSCLSEERRERSAAVLEALARYSYQYTRPAFFETIIGGRLSENPDDYEMLEIIFNAKFYNIVDKFAGNLFSGVVKGDPAPAACEDYMDSNALGFVNVIEMVNNVGKEK